MSSTEEIQFIPDVEECESLDNLSVDYSFFGCMDNIDDPLEDSKSMIVDVGNKSQESNFKHTRVDVGNQSEKSNFEDTRVVLPAAPVQQDNNTYRDRTCNGNQPLHDADDRWSGIRGYEFGRQDNCRGYGENHDHTLRPPIVMEGSNQFFKQAINFHQYCTYNHVITSNYNMVKPSALWFWDTNLVTVTRTECILYNRLFLKENKSCLTCIIQGTDCNSEHGWCRCDSFEHLLPIQSPYDIKRLRNVRKFLADVKRQNHLQNICNQMQCICICKNPGSISQSTYPLNSNGDRLAECSAFDRPVTLDNRCCGSSLERKNFFTNSHTLSHKNPQNVFWNNARPSDPSKTRSHAATFNSKMAVKEICVDIAKLNVSQRLGTDASFVPKNIEQNPKYQVNSENNLEISQPAITCVVNKNLTRVQANNHLKTRGTPDRVEETKRLRAKIKKEQVMRLKLKNQKGTATQAKKSKMDYSNSIPSFRKKSNGSIDGNDQKSFPNPKKISEAVRQKSSNHQTLSRNSQSLSTDSRMSELALMESKLRKENEEMSFRIINSRGSSPKRLSILSTNVYGVDTSKFGSDTDSFKNHSVSMFKEFVPLKEHHS